MTLSNFDLLQIHLKGLAIAPGVAIGKLFLLPAAEEAITEKNLTPIDITLEIERYTLALDNAKEELIWLQQQLESEGMTDGGAIIAAQRQMLCDSTLSTNVEQQIRKHAKNAEYILQSVVSDYCKGFNRIADPFFRERSKDVQDVCQRIMRWLKGTAQQPLVTIPPGAILWSEELSTSQVAESLLKAKGFITHYGASSSHAAIVAKTKGLPLVSSIKLPVEELINDSLVIVDGNSGEVFVNPTEETIARYSSSYDGLMCGLQANQNAEPLSFETYDGHSVKLSANIEMLSEIEFLHAHGGSGVGLFRSEYPFLSHGKFPCEEEQFALYKDIVTNMRGLPIVIRTFDLGGDKYMACQKVPYENNPFLGCRAIRYLLREKELFKTQLRAVLRASVYGNVSVMFPLVCSLSELLEAKQLLQEAHREVERLHNLELIPLKIGCMIEVPSAALTADMLAKECDFLSIGTNDLVQYTLAVDRGNHALCGLYTPAHPSVLRLIKHVVIEAGCQNIPVTVCGEVAGDVRFIPLLLGLGVAEFSIGPRHFGPIAQAIRHTSIVAARRLADRALSLASPHEIQQLLSEYHAILPFE